ncbi:hypothetical protein Tco_1404668 [Tanacetum coccineum]
MSDSEDSTVTYTAVSSLFEGLSDIGSLGVDGPPMMPKDPYAYVVAAFQASPSPDYVPSPEEPEQAPPLPEFVPELVYPEFMPQEDDVLPVEEQPLPIAASPTADSPRYIPKSDPEEDLEEDDDEDPEEDPANYPTDRDDEEDPKEEPSRDEANDEDEDEDDEDEEEEHPAPADSVPPPPVHRTTTRIFIPAQEPIPLLFEEEVERFLAIPTPQPSLLTPLSSPLPHIPSLPLPISPPLHVSSPPLLWDTELLLIRIDEPIVGIYSHPLPLLHLLSVKSSSAPTARPTRGFRADYGFVGTLDDEIRRDPEREDTDKIYRRLDNAQDDMSLMSGQLNMLRRDRHAPRTARLMESEARLSCKAWVQSMDASDTACYEVRALRTTVLAQQTEIRELLAVDQNCHQKEPPDHTSTTTPRTTSVTDKQLKRLIDQGVTDVLAAHDAERSRNGKDNHDSGTGVRRQAPLARDFTYPDFMK